MDFWKDLLVLNRTLFQNFFWIRLHINLERLPCLLRAWLCWLYHCHCSLLRGSGGVTLKSELKVLMLRWKPQDLKLICICVFVLMYFIRVFVQWEAGVDFEMGAVRVGDGSSFGNCKFAPVPVTSSPSYWTCGKFGANQMQIQNLTETRDISQKKSNSGSPLAPGLNRFSRQRRILELILILSQLLTFLLISSCTEHGSWWSQISLQNS